MEMQACIRMDEWVNEWMLNRFIRSAQSIRYIGYWKRSAITTLPWVRMENGASTKKGSFCSFCTVVCLLYKYAIFEIHGRFSYWWMLKTNYPLPFHTFSESCDIQLPIEHKKNDILYLKNRLITILVSMVNLSNFLKTLAISDPHVGV